jgi:hypothetical protein
MDRELIPTAKLFSGVPYHYAAIAPGDALVLTAGACPLDTLVEVEAIAVRRCPE